MQENYINENATISNKNILRHETFSTSEYELDYSGNLFKELSLYDYSQNKINTSIVSIIDLSSCQISDSLDLSQVYCYGQKVTPNRRIASNTLNHMNTIGFQYLDQQVQLLQKTIKEMQIRIDILENK